jgi:acetyl/propionyl-CoA carboxylase alpha subunit
MAIRRRMAGVTMAKTLSLLLGKQTYKLTLSRKAERSELKGALDGELPFEITADVEEDTPYIVLRAGGRVYRCAVARDKSGIWVSLRGRAHYFETAKARGGSASGAESSADEVRAPMTGTVIAVKVEPGATVKPGDLLVLMEAMKMEYRLESELDARVAKVECKAGDMLDVGTLLVKLEPLTST